MLDNLGALAKPIDTLVCKVCDATGVLYEPTRIRRKAKSEADALIIKTKSEVDAGEIQQRALTRLVTEEIQKQENIEDITEKSFSYINEDAKPEDIEKDWIANFFDKCKLISDNEIQELWAKILSGESNSPGSYSKRFINFLSNIDKSDAIVINKLLKFCWSFNHQEVISPLLNYTKELEVLSFSEKKHLEELGLITSSGVMGYGYTIKGKSEIILEYYGNKIKLINKKEEESYFKQGRIVFTNNAKQLFLTIFDETLIDNFEKDYYSNVLVELRKDDNFELIEL